MASIADPRGRDARRVIDIPWEGWKDIGVRVMAEFSNDRVTLVAAGAAFFLLLALFPALTAFVSIYGFVSDPQTIADHIALLGGLLPSGGMEIIEAQLEKLISTDASTLSLTFIFGLLLALWSANSGIKTLFTAMNVAYDEADKRSFIRLNLISLGFTLAAMGMGVLLLVSVGIVPAILEFAGLGKQTELLISLLRWPILFVACWGGISVIYRYGPARTRATWRWVLWGSFFATVCWLVMSMLFSWYLQNFANYDKTYGSLGAVIGLMMWTWLSMIVLVMGAEINSEIEHQTARDSTVGPEKPMGERGAVMADTIGEPRHAIDDEPSTEMPSDREPQGPSGQASEGEQPRPPRRRRRAKFVTLLALTAVSVALRLVRQSRKRGEN